MSTIPTAEEVVDPGSKKTNRSTMQRYGYPLMIILGILGAGAASFIAQDWGILWGKNENAASSGPGPKQVKVVYIDSGKIMSDVIEKITSSGGELSHQNAARVGLAVGQTIQGVARIYAAKGDMVLSRNVLAAPSSNNLTSMTEAEVMGRVNAILQKDKNRD